MGIKILLVGKKFSGKTTVAQYIKQKHGFKEYTFAEPLKEVCKQIFSLTDDQLYNQEQKERVDDRWGITPRKMFQNMGDLLREQMPIYFNVPNEPKIFTQILKNKIKDNEDLIISDGRLPDEVKWFRTLKDGIIIKIKRDGLESNDTHITEQFDYECDVVIQNNGSLEELYRTIDEIMNKIKENISLN